MSSCNDEIAKCKQRVKDLEKELSSARQSTKPILNKNDRSQDTFNNLKKLIEEHVVNVATARTYISNLKKLFDCTRTAHLLTIYRQPGVYIDRIRNATVTKKVDGESVQRPAATGSIRSIVQILVYCVSQFYSGKVSSSDTEDTNLRTVWLGEFNRLKTAVQNDYQEKIKDPARAVTKFSDILEHVLKHNDELAPVSIFFMIYEKSPSRAQLYRKIKIVDSLEKATDKGTYLFVPKNRTTNIQYFENDYKTVQKYGQRLEGLGRNLSNIIRRYLDENNLSYGDYLWKNTKKLQESIKENIRAAAKIPKDKPVAIGYLRNAYASEFKDSQAAIKMRHSDNAHANYARQLS